MDNAEGTMREEMDEILSGFTQFYILLMLSERDAHGYALIKEYHKRTGRTLSAGTLYPFLRKLEEKGLVTHEDRPVGNKPRSVYMLTQTGRTFCKRLFQRFATMVASAIEPSLEVCASCGVKLIGGGYHEIIDGKEMAFCCSHCAAAFKGERTGSEHR